MSKKYCHVLIYDIFQKYQDGINFHMHHLVTWEEMWYQYWSVSLALWHSYVNPENSNFLEKLIFLRDSLHRVAITMATTDRFEDMTKVTSLKGDIWDGYSWLSTWLHLRSNGWAYLLGIFFLMKSFKWEDQPLL